MTHLYDGISTHAEKDVNSAIKKAAKKVPAIGKALARAIPKIKFPGRVRDMVSYRDLMDYFKRRGIHYVRMGSRQGFNSLATVKDNAKAIAGYLHKNSSRNWVIVTHSKGGLDTLEALILNPKLHGEVVLGWVALQAPFHGSPIADDVKSPVTAALLKAFGGKQAALIDLTTKKRGAYMKKYDKKIRAMYAKVNVISWYSSYTPNHAATLGQVAKAVAKSLFRKSTLKGIANIVFKYAFKPKTQVKKAIALINKSTNKTLKAALKKTSLMDISATAMLLKKKRIKSDGLVPVRSTRLPGLKKACYIRGNDADHAAPAINPTPFRDDWSRAMRSSLPWKMIEDVAG